ncbi:MAG TPA: glycosyltransferase family 2 protein [Nitriliruptorales bacterium]
MAEADAPRVLAVLVAHDGAAWLPEAIDALEQQTYDHLRVIAVDNGSSDGSRDVLIDRFGSDDLLVADRDLGFAGAVSMALDAATGAPATYLLFVHDDLALAPDAVEQLVAHVQADPSVAVVGPKLVHWDDPDRLSEVGMAIDLTGRPDTGIEPDERDQGQRDHVRPVLYVSTAGMLVRRDVFEELGRFDRRYHLFRDDLDLCWRAHLAGYDVEVVPDAAARHAAAATNYHRLGQTAFIGPRYFAERNTLATLLKLYSARRLALVLPLYLLVGLLKVIGFLATRRVSDAWQTVRAWAWNVTNLGSTRRHRRRAQARRERVDGELRPLFARTAPRVRAYAEAVGEWLAGGDLEIEEAADETGEPPPAGRRLVAFVVRHPVVVVAFVLIVAGLVAVLPLLHAGQLRGGDLAPWPSDSGTFWRAYRSSWNGVGGLGSAAPPSPAQALLGAIGVITLGSAWLAQRVLVLAPLPLAWLLAYVASRVFTVRRVPRLAAATVYVLSPPALAALMTGRIGSLVAAVGLPALVIAGAPVVRPSAESGTAWRSAAGAALVAAVMVAFEPPSALVLLVLLVLVGLPAALLGAGSVEQRRGALIRTLATAVGAFLLLFPWSVTLFRDSATVLSGAAGTATTDSPLWRWLLLGPELPGFPSILPGVGFVMAGVLGLALGVRRHPVVIPGLWVLALFGGVVGWLSGRAGTDAWTWPGLPLLVAALAFAGLLAIGLGSAEEQLGQHTFGWRQVVTIATVGLVVAGLGVSALTLYQDDAWGAYAFDEPALPPFLAPEVDEVGPFRILVITDDEGVLRWDLTGPEGPTMARYGAPDPRPLLDLIGDSITEIAAGSDPGAAGRLGLANIRYVVVPEGGRSPVLGRALADQLDLEPQPVGSGLVLRVAGWLPRVSWVPPIVADSLSERGELPPGAQPIALDPVPGEVATYAGSVPGEGTLLVAEIASTGWEAAADGTRLVRRDTSGLARFRIGAPAEDVVVAYARNGRRLALVLIQLTVVLLALSLMLRPPRFAREAGVAP